MTGREKESFDEYMRRTASWGVYIENALLRKALSTIKHLPTVKTLFFFLEKRVVTVHKNKRGPARYEVDYSAEIKFSYDEAERRGIPRKRFARAIRELHDGGFIDIIHRGSGSLKDSSTYKLSKRWKAGESLPIPLRARKTREDERKLTRDAKGKWTRPEENSQVGEPSPVQGTDRPLEEVPQGTDRPLENGNLAHFTRDGSSPNLKIIPRVDVAEDVALDGDGADLRDKDNGVESNSAPTRRDDAQPSIPSKPKTARLTKAELLQKTAILLSRQPGHPRVGDRHFHKAVVSQLEDMAANRLDPGRVRAKLGFDEGLDDDIISALFAIVGVGNGAKKIRPARPRVLPWRGSPAQYRELLSTWGTT